MEGKEYKYTQDFLQYDNLKGIKTYLDFYLLNEPINILELGAFEGRSAIFMLENYCQHRDSKITTIDFEFNNQKENLEHNLSVCNNPKLEYIESDFFDILPKLLVKKNKYNLIYIDGGKSSKTTIFQIAIAWQLLEKNGILYLDDYGWGGENNERPREAIDFFLSTYKNDYKIIFQNWQVALIKL